MHTDRVLSPRSDLSRGYYSLEPSYSDDPEDLWHDRAAEYFQSGSAARIPLKPAALPPAPAGLPTRNLAAIMQDAGEDEDDRADLDSELSLDADQIHLGEALQEPFSDGLEEPEEADDDDDDDDPSPMPQYGAGRQQHRRAAYLEGLTRPELSEMTAEQFGNSLGGSIHLPAASESIAQMPPRPAMVPALPLGNIGPGSGPWQRGRQHEDVGLPSVSKSASGSSLKPQTFVYEEDLGPDLEQPPTARDSDRDRLFHPLDDPYAREGGTEDEEVRTESTDPMPTLKPARTLTPPHGSTLARLQRMEQEQAQERERAQRNVAVSAHLPSDHGSEDASPPGRKGTQTVHARPLPAGLRGAPARTPPAAATSPGGAPVSAREIPADVSFVNPRQAPTDVFTSADIRQLLMMHLKPQAPTVDRVLDNIRAMNFEQVMDIKARLDAMTAASNAARPGPAPMPPPPPQQQQQMPIPPAPIPIAQASPMRYSPQGGQGSHPSSLHASLEGNPTLMASGANLLSSDRFVPIYSGPGGQGGGGSPGMDHPRGGEMGGFEFDPTGRRSLQGHPGALLSDLAGPGGYHAVSANLVGSFNSSSGLGGSGPMAAAQHAAARNAAAVTAVQNRDGSLTSRSPGEKEFAEVRAAYERVLAENRELKAQGERTRSELIKTSTAVEGLQRMVKDREGELAGARQMIASLQGELGNVKDRLTAVTGEGKQKEQQLKELSSVLEKASNESGQKNEHLEHLKTQLKKTLDQTAVLEDTLQGERQKLDRLLANERQMGEAFEAIRRENADLKQRLAAAAADAEEGRGRVRHLLGQLDQAASYVTRIEAEGESVKRDALAMRRELEARGQESGRLRQALAVTREDLEDARARYAHLERAARNMMDTERALGRRGGFGGGDPLMDLGMGGLGMGLPPPRSFAPPPAAADFSFEPTPGRPNLSPEMPPPAAAPGPSRGVPSSAHPPPGYLVNGKVNPADLPAAGVRPGPGSTAAAPAAPPAKDYGSLAPPASYADWAKRGQAAAADTGVHTTAPFATGTASPAPARPGTAPAHTPPPPYGAPRGGGAPEAPKKSPAGDGPAPFATDLTLQDYMKRTQEVEARLMALSLEKSALESEFAKMPPNQGRTMAERKRKVELEARMDAVAKEISTHRLALKKMGAVK